MPPNYQIEKINFKLHKLALFRDQNEAFQWKQVKIKYNGTKLKPVLIKQRMWLKNLIVLSPSYPLFKHDKN